MEVQTKRSIYGKKIYDAIVGTNIMLTVLSIIVGLIVGAIVIAASGYDVVDSFKALLFGSFVKLSDFSFSSKNLIYFLNKSAPIILTGVSVAFAFKTGLFNIGAEGQYIIGSIGAALTGVLLPFDLPAIVHIPLTFLVGVLLAGIWGGFAGFLKANFGINEVISTIMLNWIAFYILNYIITLPFINSGNGSETTKDIKASARITATMFTDLNRKANFGILIAIILAILIGFILYKTTLGYELRAVGLNRNAAEYGGIPVKRSIISSMAISGMLSGAAGAIMVMGDSFNVARLAVQEGYGFDGIAVALIANNSPIGTIFSGLLFGNFREGARHMQSNTGAPSELINIIIGIIVLFIAVPNLIRMLISFKSKKAKAGA